MIPVEQQKKIEEHVRGILEALGYEPSVDPHFRDTPKRVAKMFGEVLDGNYRHWPDFKKRMTVFEERQYKDLEGALRDIPALAARQGALLDAAWTLLRPGGRLLYTT